MTTRRQAPLHVGEPNAQPRQSRLVKLALDLVGRTCVALVRYRFVTILSSPILDNLGEAKVSNLDPPLSRDEQVLVHTKNK